MNSPLVRAALGLVLSIMIAGVARRARSLSGSGTIAAIAVGTVCVAAGFAWGIMLLVFFGLSTALSHFRSGAKALRTESVVAKGGERDAWQVLANGGVFALSAALSLATSWPGWMSLGAGSLAASASDTWSTEIGTLSLAQPRSILSGRRVEPGTSGGVTFLGFVGALGGAASIAAAAVASGWPWRIAFAVLAGGVVGSTIDSLLGATLQARRWCDRCNAFTERAVHRCGAVTRLDGGVAWLDNDVVNVACAIAGGALALILAR